MGNDRIIIKGNKEGLNAIINIDKFGNFEEMLDALIEKLSKGKKFYKGSTLCITTKLSSLTEKDVESLKVVLFEEIGIKDIVFEDKDIKDKESESKIFNGVYEGRTKFIRKTVRGGQCVDFQGNIVIVGDVNSGAEVYAGGNIIVLGSIKGNVYAGVGGNRKAIIAAFALQPEILKIGDIITISPDDFEKPKYPEVAKVKDDAIIVEPYLTKLH
ncbi:septum site-determining protein MinC [Clostridium sp.]|uniref:septum site-determining protein MinC n=1 Tax=Clostridium sp. TaxID=1506 RepID=UPI0028FE8AD1|nr:septum site-determining protein MinC [Clostridium sp.]MDU1309200.1 septum site-determining protein MinC [Clostridium sp.]